MQITINTKEDSPADIRKVIALLSKMIEGSPEKHSNIFEESTPVLGASGNEEAGLGESSSSEPASGGNAFAAMFGGDNSGSAADETPVLGAEEKTPVLGAEEPVPVSEADEAPVLEDDPEPSEEEKEAADTIIEY